MDDSRYVFLLFPKYPVRSIDSADISSCILVMERPRNDNHIILFCELFQVISQWFETQVDGHLRKEKDIDAIRLSFIDHLLQLFSNGLDCLFLKPNESINLLLIQFIEYISALR